MFFHHLGDSVIIGNVTVRPPGEDTWRTSNGVFVSWSTDL